MWAHIQWTYIRYLLHPLFLFPCPNPSHRLSGLVQLSAGWAPNSPFYSQYISHRELQPVWFSSTLNVRYTSSSFGIQHLNSVLSVFPVAWWPPHLWQDYIVAPLSPNLDLKLYLAKTFHIHISSGLPHELWSELAAFPLKATHAWLLFLSFFPLLHFFANFLVLEQSLWMNVNV